MTAKFYIFVDESGQDTAGRFFIVGMVVIQGPVEHARSICEEIEAQSGKGARKWSKTSVARRRAYIAGLLARAELRSALWYALFTGRRDYPACTVEAIATALRELQATDATVFIDGLTRAGQRQVGLELRRCGCPVGKARGREDESDPLIRLADALCGFTRARLEGEPEFAALWDAVGERGFARELLCDQ